MPSSLIGAVLDEFGGASACPSAPVRVTQGDQVRLVEVLAAAPDPRARRGVRYRCAVVLAVAVCATLAGARTFAAIADWVADLPAEHREQIGLTGRGGAVPGATTIWRVLTRLDAAVLQATIGTWLRSVLSAATDSDSNRRVLAVDGKALRATRRGDRPVHLLAALDHHRGVVVAQVDVDAKTNEIPLFNDLLNQIEDLAGSLSR